MKTFDYSSYQNKLWDIEILNYLAAIHEAKGKQGLYLVQQEATLNKLVELAKLQSTEASNAIEGIRTTETRLRQLFAEKTTPRNRDEKEILGYRDALNIVHESFEYVPLTPSYILQLHKIMLSYTDAGFGGQYKNVQNYISARDAEGKQFILFQPLSPWETGPAMEEACRAYNLALGEGKVDPLLLIPCFIHDFLCIHPFIDGNGRMSRLLTTLLLYRSGYFIGKYISLEAKLAHNKDAYYMALQESQVGWHEGRANHVPFIKYLLGVIISAYRDLASRMELVGEQDSSLGIVQAAVAGRLGKFTKSQLLELCPSLSASAIEKALKQLCLSGAIEKRGAGRGTYYLRKNI